MIYVHVSNTYRSKLRAGIQRLVVSFGRELLRDLRFTFVVFDHLSQSYFSLVNCTSFPQAIYEEKFDKAAFSFDALGSGDVFFEMDAIWGDGIDRTDLYQALKARDVIIVGILYDTVPITLSAYSHPNTVLNYLDCFVALTTHADYIFTISKVVERELQAVSLKYNGFGLTTRVVPLGSDFYSDDDGSRGSSIAELDGLVDGRRFFLSVGTIEPRKNHELLLQAFEQITHQDALLMLVGRRGWNTDAFVARLTSHEDFGTRILWLEDVDDAGLLYLYQHCCASVVTSRYEGYGLPAAEALALGCPTITTDGGALKEVVGEHAAVLPSGDSALLAQTMQRALDDTSYYENLRDKASSYPGISWSTAARRVIAFVEEITEGAEFGFDTPVRQVVYLSINPASLALSLRHIKEHLPFIDRVVVLTKRQHERTIVDAVGQHFDDGVILCDDDVLDFHESDLTDHQARNTLLRSRLYGHPSVEANFIAADDDYLALNNIGPEFYIDRGVHQAYYFLTDMGHWAGAFPEQTSYDKGLFNTWRLLRRIGSRHLGFSSHMPQVVNKRLANIIFERFVTAEGPGPYDEWSLYFNLASHLYPARFAMRPYQTLNWPMSPCDWLPDVVPQHISFENISPEGRGKSRSTWEQSAEERAAAYLSEIEGARADELGEDGASVSQIVLTVTDDGLWLGGDKRLRPGPLRMRRVLVDNRRTRNAIAQLTMSLLTQSGEIVRHAAMTLDQARWIPLYAPDTEGDYWLTFRLTEASAEIATLAVEVQVRDQAPDWQGN